MLSYDLLYYVQSDRYTTDELKDLLQKHEEIKFVSLVGVDLGGNDTDEKIPISLFLEDISAFLSGGGVQTDGSSVVLPGIATLNNGKVDLIPDSAVRWFVDYNYGNIDPATNKPVGTLRIPSFLKHNGKLIDSRSILKAAVSHFKQEILSLIKNNAHAAEALQLNPEDIEDILLTSATELEFWVHTPEDVANITALSASQHMQEQYWKRTKGLVRTAMERSLTLLDNYGLEAEMGHKEVGGVKAKVDATGNFSHVMEQLEIDWKYSTALQAADNELIARTKIKELFQNHGLDCSFNAKPIDSVAGNGEHTHVGVALKLNNGSIRNLFSPIMMEDDYMNIFGWGALMGMLKNYEVVNPFISGTNDALNRLQPGFEAPICIVGSIGHSLETPSRNRTVLVGLIRDMENPLATRFEVRSPNPHSNTYLTIAALYQSVLDGIKAAVSSGLSTKELENIFNKKAGEEVFYLEKNREYRSEEDVFEEFDLEQRTALFGHHPATVWENVQGFGLYPEKVSVLKDGSVFTDSILESYRLGCINKWTTEIIARVIPNMAKTSKYMVKVHDQESGNALDDSRWAEIQALKNSLFKDTIDGLSLVSQMRQAIDNKEYEHVSELQSTIKNEFSKLKSLYTQYKRNII
ncbi:glutamine synthetase [Clostridia bacterium]|nr:glutamine synthetase [Clostridia bacterium]